MTSPTRTVPAADLLREIAGCLESHVHEDAIINLRCAADELDRASPPRGGDGAAGITADVTTAQAAAEAGEPTLLPCPFCGSRAMLEHNEDRWSVGCAEGDDAKDGECIGYISLTTFARKSEAIAAWNRRAQPIPGAGERVPFREYVDLTTREAVGDLRKDAEVVRGLSYETMAQRLEFAAELLSTCHEKRRAAEAASPPPAPAPVDMLEKLRAASGQPERAPQSPPPTESSGPHGSPPPATGEVGDLIVQWNNNRHADNGMPRFDWWERHGNRMAAALAEQQREIERLREQPSEVLFPNHPLRKDQVYTLESVGPLLDRVESLTTSLDQARAVVEGMREKLLLIKNNARTQGEAWCAYQASLALEPPPSEGLTPSP